MFRATHSGKTKDGYFDQIKLLHFCQAEIFTMHATGVFCRGLADGWKVSSVFLDVYYLTINYVACFVFLFISTFFKGNLSYIRSCMCNHFTVCAVMI